MSIIIRCKVERLLPEGGALAHYEGGEVEVYNALPGEVVEAQILRRGKERRRAVACNILEPSSLRQKPYEDHYLSCSPWQIMDFASENRYKHEMVQEILRKHGWKDIAVPLRHGDARFGYRNKMEFSFTEDEGLLSLAFFKRTQKVKMPIEGCILAEETLDETALSILESCRAAQIEERSLKAMILRCNHAQEVIASLFVTRENFPPIALPASGQRKGWSIYFSNPRSPASVATKLLHQEGVDFLTETILGKPLQFGIMSFFQIHVDLFSQALEKMAPFVDGEEVLDFYSGVGSISLALSDRIQSALLVDSCEDSIFYAKRNIQNLGLSRYEARLGPAEKLLDAIEEHKVMIVDPPRVGLHPKVVQRICEVKPKRLIYLSCNILSCMENLSILEKHYRVIFSEAYNFFPATAHVEFLAVLERKE